MRHNVLPAIFEKKNFINAFGVSMTVTVTSYEQCSGTGRQCGIIFEKFW